jgi:DNA segregation ATPase FtsK/SpoIIIE, S-DNA-T family
MVKWIKKLFAKEDEYIEEIEQPLPRFTNERDGNGSDVAYTYPQGKFRFPVIPDEPSVAKQPTYEEKVEKVPARPPQPRRYEAEKKPVVERPAQKVARPEPVKKEIMKKRPFRPTEIPSPIYGFNRPAQPPVVEKEETTYVPVHNEYEEQPLFYQEEARREFASSSSYETNREEAQYESESPTFQEKEYYPPVYEETTVNVEKKELFYKEDEFTPYTQKKDEDIVEVNIQPYRAEQEEEHVENISIDANEETFVQEQMVHQQLSHNDYKEEVRYESFAQEELVNLHEETNVVDEELNIVEESYTSTVKESSSSISKEESQRVENEKQEEQRVSMEQSNHREQERPVKKRVVPYNVMMLKQDRVQQTQQVQQGQQQPNYQFPSLSLLNVPPHSQENDEEWIREQAELLHTALQNFNVGAKVVHYTQGPAVTRFEVQPDPGVKVNKITNLTDDIKLNLAAKDIRIEAPIPGKNTVGIEVPNRMSKPVMLREILRTPAFTKDESPVPVALGLDISGKPIVTDVKKMPHGLIAGATGSGKSVCINAILLSILYKAQPHEVKLMLIDPKMVELAPYNNIPHLVSPVITDVKAATAALKWAVEEMERRYELFAHAGVRDLTRFNELAKKHGGQGEPLPYLVIVIDELADLMMVAPGDVEESICRIAQKARACGIHLLLATQRPSVDVITGLIKANIPTRLAFTVSSQIDSRTIIDTNGADKLLGRGDMLFLENGSSKPIRVQGVYVSDEEIERVVSHVKQQMQPNYLFQQEDLVLKATSHEVDDDLFHEACEFIIEQGGASASSLQRRFRIGYNRAARLVDMMESQGIISEARGSKPREVLITEDELTDMNV